MSMNTTMTPIHNLPKREALPLFDWYGGEANYFLASREDQKTILLGMTEGLADQAFIKW